MSKESDDFNQKLDKDIEFANRKKVVDEKGLILREHKVTRDLDELLKNTTELEQQRSVSFAAMTAEAIAKLVSSNDDYMEAAKNSMQFMNKEFGKLVPYFRKNLILVCGDTGNGKSTTVANIAYNTIIRKNPATGKTGRVLVLTNEEAPEDFYNRLTCLHMGWTYSNHNEFTDEQRKVFSEYIPRWATGGRLTVIGDTYEGIPGWTHSVEGIQNIFTNLLRDGNIYDAVIIDYFQNIRYSKNDPSLDEYECQRRVSGFLDEMKIIYPAPIVLMAQMKRLVDDDDTTPYNIRFKGSKLITDKATFICEVTPERDYLRCKWRVWKSRFTTAVGEHLYTGYDRGKYVPYSVDFQKNVAKLVDRNLERKKEQELGIPSEKEKEEKDET